MEVSIPQLVYAGQACFKCYMRATDAKLQRCSRCKRIRYCGSECQTADNGNHKKLCRALSDLLNDDNVPMPPYETSTREELEHHSIKLSYAILDVVKQKVRRPLSLIEQNIVVWEPRCMVCYKRGVDINPGLKSNDPSVNLLPCAVCHLSFFCCEEHRNISKEAHQVTIMENGLTQCELNQQCNKDQHLRLKAKQPESEKGWDSEKISTFVWSPSRVRKQYKIHDLLQYDPLVGPMEKINDITPHWRQWFADNEAPFTGVPTIMRLATKCLTIPLTTLYGFNVLCPNEEFGPKLVIHYIGAADFEAISCGPAYEEITHSIPTTKHLDLHLIGPELTAVTEMANKTEVLEMDCCQLCQKSGRTRSLSLHAYKYHDWAQKAGNYVKPDLAVIFNCGIHEEEASFAPTIRFLVEKEIPTIVTSYNELEVRRDFTAVLDAVKGASGVNVVLEPKRNPWRCELGHPEPCGQWGYYYINGWTFAFSGSKKADAAVA